MSGALEKKLTMRDLGGAPRSCCFCDLYSRDDSVFYVLEAGPVKQQLQACKDRAACSDRMEAQGLGRRDFAADVLEDVQHALLEAVTPDQPRVRVLA